MIYGIVEEFGRIAMSQNLAASLARASAYAQSQLHREVGLEHLLLALTEDPDAAQVLTASNIDIGRLNADVSAMIGRIEDRNPPERANAISVSPDLKRILEAAGAAAAKGRRREVNGAIVIAAIVGDGRTTAAHLLRAQGLTFDEAIRVLRAAPPATVTVASAAAQTAPQPEQVAGARSRASTEDILASARERVQRARSEAAVAGAQTGAQQLPISSEPAATYQQLPGIEAQPVRTDIAIGDRPYPQRSAYAEPPPAPMPEPSPFPEPYYDAPPAPAEAEGTYGHPPPLPVAGEKSLPPFATAPDPRYVPDAGPPPPPWPVDEQWAHDQSQALPHLGWTPPPALPVPGAQEPADWNGAEAAARYAVPGIERAPALSSGIPGAGPAPSYREPQLPPHPVYPPWPEPAAEPIADYAAYQDVSQPPMPQAPNPAPRSRSPSRPERLGGAQLSESGQLVENIPRVMRKLVPVVVEVRIAKTDVNELMSDMGNGPTYRHEMLITKAMSVRLRAPEGGFFIETTSPETQWIENTLGLMSADFASWRWTVTPRSTGKRRLQLVVAARTVGADGLAAETALPERVIDVAVRTNYALAFKAWGGWIAAAIVGGALSKFGQSLLDASTKLATLLKAG